MSFDNTDPVQLALLNAEVNNDPIGMGYAAVINTSKQVTKLLNDPDKNVNGDTASRVFDVAAMMDALNPTDYGSQQTSLGTPDYVLTLVNIEGRESRDISIYKTKFRSMFAANSATVTALDAQQADLSRAEFIFGQGTVITTSDWIAARDI
jgi:hypothetical protein